MLRSCGSGTYYAPRRSSQCGCAAAMGESVGTQHASLMLVVLVVKAASHISVVSIKVDCAMGESIGIAWLSPRSAAFASGSS